MKPKQKKYPLLSEAFNMGPMVSLKPIAERLDFSDEEQERAHQEFLQSPVDKKPEAEIPEGGVYHPSDTIGSFIGWFPADDPEVIVLIKLDRTKSSPWGSMTAAPTFANLALDLANLLNIPPDGVRLQQEILEVRGN